MRVLATAAESSTGLNATKEDIIRASRSRGCGPLNMMLSTFVSVVCVKLPRKKLNEIMEKPI